MTRGRLGRTIAALAAAAMLCAAPSAAERRLTPPPALIRIAVQAKPIAHFEARDASRRQFGLLEFRGGIELTSKNADFGGISSIAMERDGQRFLAVTDKGRWLRARIRYEDGKPVGIDDAEMAPILGPDGRPITARRWYDTEALAEDRGTVYVGIERVHQILKFDFRRHGLAARGHPLALPHDIKGLPSNKGIEGLIVAPRGSALAGALVAFSERGLDEAGNIRGFIIGGPTPGSFAVKRSKDFDITDAAVTARGDVFILERKFSLLSGPGMRIRQVPISAIAPGMLVDGRVVIEADAGYQIDNMEGLALHQGVGGELILTVVSDDNFSMLQRTLLLQFTFVEP
jgi:hypothetical protein